MKISLIVAMDTQRGIGKNNDLMWHLPADMQFFKNTTKGHIVAMGRKNYDSIPEKFRPLPDRINVVLTRNTDFSAPNCLIFHDLNDCLNHFKTETEKTLFIIGGGEIYKLALAFDVVDEMYITRVNGVFEADTFFPTMEENKWQKSVIFEQEINDKHSFSFVVEHYTKTL
jgi:dihydrofolate reductase